MEFPRYVGMGILLSKYHILTPIHCLGAEAGAYGGGGPEGPRGIQVLHRARGHGHIPVWSMQGKVYCNFPISVVYVCSYTIFLPV